MQLLSVGIARSVWLFDISELTPSGKSVFPELLVWMGDKYSFQTFPKSIAELDEKTKGFVFTMGEFHTTEGPIAVNFSFFNDGIVAESWASTEQSDAFLEDVLRSARQKFGLAYSPDMIRSKQYISELNVRLDYPLANVNSRIVSFCNTLTEVFKKHNLPPFELTGMVFSTDTSASSYKPPGCIIERKIGAPFSDNRFWSKSPFTTKDHLRVLGEFEQLLAAP